MNERYFMNEQIFFRRTSLFNGQWIKCEKAFCAFFKKCTQVMYILDSTRTAGSNTHIRTHNKYKYELKQCIPTSCSIKSNRFHVVSFPCISHSSVSNGVQMKAGEFPFYVFYWLITSNRTHEQREINKKKLMIWFRLNDKSNRTQRKLEYFLIHSTLFVHDFHRNENQFFKKKKTK